ncbi:MAG TPA: PAS domain S-box protein [archaeon]|nr:PAS domain S-box protein [archaeon]
MLKEKLTYDDLLKKVKELEEKARRGNKAEIALKNYKKRFAHNLSRLDKITKEVHEIRSMVNMPQLYLDYNWNIVGYSSDFPLLTSKVVEYARERKNLKEIFNGSDFEKIKKNQQMIKALENLPYDKGREWVLRYRGPNAADKIDQNWIVYRFRGCQSANWQIVDQNGKLKIVHDAHIHDDIDCCLMTREEYGGADEDIKLTYKVKTAEDKDYIRDLTAIISGTSGREAIIPDVIGYTICFGSNNNTEGRIQKQGADVLSRQESLDPDTEYEITVERTGGRIYRGLRNLKTGQEMRPLEFIDCNAIYDRQNHIGLYTFSGAAEFYDIEIYTRKSLFSIEQFRLPFNIELGIKGEQSRGRIFQPKYAKTCLMGQNLHTLMLEDITKRKKDEEALRESEEKYRKLFEESRIALCITTPDGMFIGVNPEMVNLFGYTQEEFLNSNAVRLYVNPEDRKTYLNLLEKQGFTRDYELKFKEKDGTQMDVLVTSTVHRDKEGNILYIQGSIHDITERKRMEAQLKESQKMEVIGRLASGVAHEVRNPLNAILAITEALFQDIGDSPEYKPYLDHIHTQVDRLSTLMKDLLELGKPLLRSNFIRSSLYDICAEAVELWQQSSSYRRLSVRLLPPDKDCKLEVIGDSSKLKQVLLNLMENAAQHSPEDGKITVSLRQGKDSTVRVSVKDQGSGMAPEIMSEVFKPFFTTRPRGAGLGLSIVQSIIETHDGWIRLYNNEPPPGLTAEINLPLAQEESK